MAVSSLKILGKLQTIDGTAVRQSRDLDETFTVGETLSGQFILPKGGTAAKVQLSLPGMTNPNVVLVQSDCTFKLEIPHGGSTVIECDQMALLGLPTYSGLTSLGITMISDVTQREVVWSIGAVGS